MSQIGSFANVPGLLAAQETYEAGINWGPDYRLLWLSAVIDSGATDSGNTPTWRLRPGLIMGKKTATGAWTNYSATATDGSQIAAGVLADGMRMQDIYTGANTTKFYRMIVGGPILAENLIGLDQNARNQMAFRFIFDDNIGSGAAGASFPWAQFQNKTANYSVVAGDNFSLFDTKGAVAEVDFTLPPIGPGYYFGFYNDVNQTMKVISNEGGNIIAFNNAAATTLAFQTGGNLIGAFVAVFSDPGGVNWRIEVNSLNTLTVS